MEDLTLKDIRTIEAQVGSIDTSAYSVFGTREQSQAEVDIAVDAMKACLGNIADMVLRGCWDYSANNHSNKRIESKDGTFYTKHETKYKAHDEAFPKFSTDESGKQTWHEDWMSDNFEECWFDHPAEGDIRKTISGECLQPSVFNRDIVMFENMKSDESAMKEGLLTGFNRDKDHNFIKLANQALEDGEIDYYNENVEEHDVIRQAMRTYAENKFIATYLNTEQPEIPDILMEDFTGETAEEFWQEYTYELTAKEKNRMMWLCSKGGY